MSWVTFTYTAIGFMTVIWFIGAILRHFAWWNGLTSDGQDVIALAIIGLVVWLSVKLSRNT